MLSENDLELLSAYLDGALSEAERAALETRLQSDAQLRRELARLRATVELINGLPTLSAPRPLTLTPRMVRRPTVWVSASFSALSAAAAVILLVIGAALFSTPGNHANAVTAARDQVALAPTEVDLFAATAAINPASGGSLANSPETTSQKQSTPSEVQLQSGQVSDGLRQTAPTQTAVAPLAFALAQPTETALVAQANASNAQESATNPQLDTAQAAAPSVINGTAAQAPLPVEPATPTTAPTSTLSPTNTATSIPTRTAILTATPTLTPLPALQETTPSETNSEGVGLIAAALVLFGIAVVTTILRRNAR